MKSFPKVILKTGKEKSVLRYHPWIFSGAIKSIESNLTEGDIVEVFTENNEYLATGHYQIGTITVRVFSFTRIEPDKKYWKTKLFNAIVLRQKFGLLGSTHTNVLRLINGEGDGMPGLIIDFYNGTAVIQAHSIGMYYLRNTIAEVLREIFNDKLICVYDKSESTLPYKANIPHINEVLYGSVQNIVVSEYNNKYGIDVEEGQKTGFFIDQRENRKLVESYSKDATALNVFSYTGGFSVAALRGGAKMVHSVDSSQRAIDLGNKNVNLNFDKTDRHESFCADAFDYLETIDNKYDLIILDPPAFAKHQDVLDKAIKGYRNINKKAIEKIRPRSILFTFSCSQVISKEEFKKTIFSAAALARRQVRIIQQLSHSVDHPVDIYHPEGEYLKGLMLFVE